MHFVLIRRRSCIETNSASS